MIIALGHRSGHGKDTFAELLQSKLGKDKVYIRSWADAVKETSQKLYGHLGLQDRNFYNTREGREVRNFKLAIIDLTPVEIWIKVGEGMRAIYWDTWKDQLHNYYEALPPDTILVVPDTRHINEVESADLSVKIVNTRIPDRTGMSIDDILQHHQFNCTISNNGTLEEYSKSIDLFIQELKLATYTDRSHFAILGGQNPRRLSGKIFARDGGSM